MYRSLAFVVTLVALLALPPAPARAQLTIEIVGGAGTPLPIAVVPFEGEARYPVSVTNVIGADLARSGLFKLVDGDSVIPRATRPEDVQLPAWRARGADAVVVGTTRSLPDGRVEIRYALVDVVKQATLEAQIYTVTPAQLKVTAHKIADTIYEKLTGDPGVFSTRIAYITKQGTRYQLLVADADGSEPQTIVTSNEPLLSPRWAPDGTRIAYVSYESKKPVVYVQNLANGSRAAVANFRGSNSSPAWSPDGRKLAVTLSKDGGSQLYLMNADGSDAQRVMASTSIDTEAYFMPDGRSLLFTSDRGGTPQIYQLTLGSNTVDRLTFDGSYNVSPRPAPDGKSFTFVRRDGAKFQIATQDIASRQVQVLTAGPLDESPSVAPNGKLILYANEVGGRGILAAVSSDGRVKQRLSSTATDVREPAWGPYPRP